MSSNSGATAKPHAVDLYVQGVQAYQQGDKQAAQVRLEQAAQENPKLEMAHSMLGDMYREQGDYGKARTQYETLTHLDPYGADNFYRLGVVDQLLQRFEDAAASYLRALKLRPNYASASMNLGTTYLALNQLSDAEKYATLATEQNPKLAAAWTNLGVTLDATKKYATAEWAYKKALELDANQSVAEMNLGANLVLQNKGAEAVSVMEQAVKKNSDAPTRTVYAQALSLAGRNDDAIAQINLALKLEPHYYPALNELGNASIQLYQKGLQLDENLRLQAIDAWKRSLVIAPNQPRQQQLLRQWTENKLFTAPAQ
jgi:tetratricopeptide (TPR) repeat protein